MIEAQIGDFGIRDIQSLEPRHMAYNFERAVRNSRAAHVQPRQMLPALDRGQALVGDPLGVKQTELFDLWRGLQIQHSLVADASMREVQPLEIGQASQLDHVGVVDPASPQIYLDDASAAIALDL